MSLVMITIHEYNTHSQYTWFQMYLVYTSDDYISSEPCSGDLYSQSEYPELRTSTPQLGFSDASNYHPRRYGRDYNPRKQQYNDGRIGSKFVHQIVFIQLWTHQSQLIIRHLHPMITEELLCGELSSFGNIMQMKLKPDKKFPNVNFTYITFEYTESAEKAVQHVNSEAFLPNWTFFPNRPKVFDFSVHGRSILFRLKCITQSRDVKMIRRL